MELEAIRQELKSFGESLVETSSLDCYLFGSILTNPTQANDVDILIVYDNRKNVENVKQQLKSLFVNMPLHLIFFTRLEEQELDFVKQQKAEKVFSL